jgi:hypothetical protein
MVFNLYEGNKMLEMIDIGVENAVAYRLEGKITEEEMTSILTLFKERIEKGEKLNVYQEVVSIGGVELDAMIENFKFFHDVGFPIPEACNIAMHEVCEFEHLYHLW